MSVFEFFTLHSNFELFEVFYVCFMSSCAWNLLRCVKARGKWRDLLRYKDIWYVLPGKWQKLSLQSSLFTSRSLHLFIHSLLPSFSYVLLVPFLPHLALCLLPFPPPAPALTLFSAPHISFSSLALISAALVICVPYLPPSSSHPLSSPLPPFHHLQAATRFASSSSHIMYTQSTSQLLCFLTPSTLLLSLRLLFHFFSPVRCDGSQAGDSCNSRQWAPAEGGDDDGGMQGWRGSQKAVGLEGEVPFFLFFDLLPKQKQRRRACSASLGPVSHLCWCAVVSPPRQSGCCICQPEHWGGAVVPKQPAALGCRGIRRCERVVCYREVLNTVLGCDSLTWRRHDNSCSTLQATPVSA